MEKKECIEWIEQWFRKKKDVIADIKNVDFFRHNLLTSFETLELVLEIESHFKILLPENALTDPRFSTINGLADILTELKTQDGVYVN